MGASKFRRFGPRVCAIGILVGFAMFLIGAQLPHYEMCFRGGLCVRETLIDLTSNRHSTNDAWQVSMWLARLAPLLVAAGLIYRSAVARRRAAGFVAFLGSILVALYLPRVVPAAFEGGWGPGAALWPLGAIVMTICATLARRRDVAGRESGPAPSRVWLVLMLAGIVLAAVAIWIGSQETAYLFAVGMAAFAASLLLMRGRITDRPAHARWAVVPLLLGSALVAASYFAAWSRGEHPYFLIRTEFMFDLRRADFWEFIVLLSLIAAAVVASMHLLRKGVPNSFLVGGALAGPYFLLAALSPAFGDEGFSRAAPAVQLAITGIVLMLVGVLYMALREIPARQLQPTTG